MKPSPLFFKFSFFHSRCYFDETLPEMTSKYGFKCSFNPTFAGASGKEWISKGYCGLDQGPMVLMIENYRSGFLWRLMRRCPYIIDGLSRAGFGGGGAGRLAAVSRDATRSHYVAFRPTHCDALLLEKAGSAIITISRCVTLAGFNQ
ncbi:MAG TPA: glucoamylase family protein [Pyrinomonadaceae bacterium]|nr:glucoamylase family protein [Pyrinomonadaceae bacterium]